MKTKVAVIGYGLQGSWHCGEILTNSSHVVTLAGICDIDESKQALAREKGIKVYKDFQSVLEDENVDAIVIATPNDLHKEMAVKAMVAGKHVVCEKPVEMSVAALDEMLDASKRTGKVFTVHQNRRWDTNYLVMKDLIQSGDIGEVISIESRIQGSRGIPANWRGEKEHGGGMMLDWGVHLIDQMLQLIPSRITRIFSVMSHITTNEVDDGFKLEIYFEDGKSAHIEVGTYNFITMPRFYMQCRKGSARIEEWTDPMKVAKLKLWKEDDVKPHANSKAITMTMSPRNELTLDYYEVEQPVRDTYEYYHNFCQVIAGNEALIVKPEEVRRVMQVMEAAFDSDRKKQSVEVSI